MTDQTTTMMPCDHCGGTVRIHQATDDRGDHVTYTCDGCGCRWVWGFVLEHKGARCPVHGEAADYEPPTVLASSADFEGQDADFCGALL